MQLPYDLTAALAVTDAARDARLVLLLERERAAPAPDGVLWWCSFADADGFRGVAVVAAPGAVHAIRRTHELGINPGGEVAVVPVLARGVPESHRDRLLDARGTAELNAYAAGELS